MQWIPNDENKRRDEAFADFIGGVAYEEDRGWSKEVWDAAWSARREWVGLTDEQIINEADGFDWDKDCAVRFARAIEAKLREKNK
jgi:hypothetical protein